MSAGERATSFSRRLSACTRGTLALTVSQLFMGALTIGIASFRGTESYESFYYETQLGHANYGASKLVGDHARASNSNANNNVISTSIMGPRFAVEGDNITVLVDGAIACGKCSASAGSDTFDCNLCKEFTTNYPLKMLPKLAWVRIKQAILWGALSKLTGVIDQVASLAALDQVKSTVSAIDSQISIRAVDPSTKGVTWGTPNISTACSNALTDVLPSPIPGSAFPPVLSVNLMGQSFCLAMTQTMPRVICAVAGSLVGGGGASTGLPLLPQVPSVSTATSQDCNALQDEMQQQIQQQQGGGALGSSSPSTVFSSDVMPYVSCGTSSASAPIRTGWGQSYSYAGGGGQLSTCTFNQQACQQAMLKSNSASYIQSVGLPSTIAQAASALGGSTLAPTDSDWNHSHTMRACTFASKPIDSTIATINDNVTTLISFGNQTVQPKQLRANHEFQSCGKWYFPDASGDFGGTPHDQQPFVAAWKFAMVMPGTGK